MKFTKENALEQIKLQLGQTPDQQVASDRTLSETIDNLLPLIANDDMELTDFVTKVMPSMKSVNLNVKNDVTTKIKDFKTNYKPETTVEKKPDEKPDEKSDERKVETTAKPFTKEDFESWMNPFKQQVETLQNQIVTKNILSQALTLRDALKPDTKNQQAWVDDAWQRATAEIKPETKPEDIITSFKTTYEGYMSRLGANGYIPADGSTGTGKSKAQETLEKMKAEEKTLLDGAKSPAERLGLTTASEQK